MKRLITIICLILVIVLGFVFIKKGFETKSFKIANYKTIESKSEALTKKLAGYDKKNGEEYESAVTSLNTSVKMFNNSKEKYEKIYSELADVLNTKDEDSDEEETVVEQVIYSDKEKYAIDFLYVSLGNYAKKEGVDVTFRLETSSTTDPNASTLNYFLADLKFTVTGEYMNIATFISDLENDDKIAWQINDFQMAESGSAENGGVTAQFTVRDIPIDSESYLESSDLGTDVENIPNENVDGEINNSDTNTITNTDTNTNMNNAVVNTTSNVTNTVVNNTVN